MSKKITMIPDFESSEQERFVIRPTVLFNENQNDNYGQGKIAVASRTYMRGLVMGSCDGFKRPVVILQKSSHSNNENCANCGKDENTAFCCSGTYSRLESTLFYDNWAKFCKKIREKDRKAGCCKRDGIVADYLINNIDTLKEGSTKILCGEEEISGEIIKKSGYDSHVCFRYECPVSHYDEIAININVNGIAGVMIVGQLLFEDTDKEQKARFEKAFENFYKNDKKDDKLLEDIKSTNLKSTKIVDEVFVCVKEIEEALNREYAAKVSNNIKTLQEKMIETFENFYKNTTCGIDTYESKVEICEQKYDILKKAFNKALKELKNATNNQMEIYYSIPSGLYFNSKNDIIKVCGILTDAEKKVFNSFEPKDSNEFEKVTDGIFAYSKKLDLLEKRYVSLMIKYDNIDEHIEDLFERFLQFSCLYITELFAQFNGIQITEYTTIMRHELGQLNEAILIRINSYQEAINKQDENYYTYEFLDECNHMLEDFKSHAHSTMLRCNSSRYFSLLPDLNKEWFYPYESFLHKWKYIYLKASKNKQINFVMSPVQKSDLSRPLMYADKSMIEQVAYNLTNNALKYSIPGTTINVDCKLNDNKDAYLLVVSNYGRAIKKEEEKQIFKYGFRGSNNNQAHGSGLGLYLSRKIAEAHGGTLTLKIEEVSSFDVSCLYLYNDMPDFFINKDQEAQIECELSRLNKTEYIEEIKKPALVNDTFTPYLINQYLDKGTFKYTFVLSIPYIRKRSGGLK